MSFEVITDLRVQRRKISEQMTELVVRAGSEKRALTGEETEKFSKMEADEVALKATIDRMERAWELAKEMAAPITPPPASAASGADDKKEAEHRAFEKYFRYGIQSLDATEVRLLRSQPLESGEKIELRAQTVTTTGGGYLIPEGFAGALEVAQKPFGSVESVSRVITTSTGNDLPFPTMNDTSNTGVLIGINTAATEQALTFGQKVYKAYKFSSYYVLIPNELLQDSAISLEQVIADAFGERLGRVKNTYFTTGTGTAQPEGIVTGSAAGATAAAAAAVAYGDLVNLEHSVNRAYRIGAKWMFHDSTLKAIKKLLDTQNRPLWVSGLAFKEPDTILGYPYVTNDDMAELSGSESPAVAEKTILFGNFQKYIVRRVRPFAVLRLAERFAEYDQVAFLAFERADGGLLDAGTNPVKHLVHPTV